MTTHELKIDIKYFDDVKNGKKNFEIRKNDRDFQVGDILELRAYKKDSFVFWRTTPSENHDDYWQTCLKEKSDMIQVRVLWVSNILNNYNKLLDDAGLVFSLDSMGLILEIETVIADFFDDEEKLAGYVVLGIEVVE